MFKKVAFLAAVGIAVASQGAFAATDTQTMAVSASIGASCTLATNPLAFGSLASTSVTDTDASATATVTCTADSPFNVGIDFGLNPDLTTRRMASGGNFMIYEVYVDAGRTTPYVEVGTFGDAGNFNSALTGITGANNVTIFGRIPVQSTPPSGSYADTLTVTVNY